MKVEKTGYYTLLEQATLVKASIDLGKTSFLSDNTANLLLTTLTGYVAGSGVVSVAIENQGCADEAGATFEYTVDGQPAPASVKLIYASDGFPDSGRTSAQTGSFPHGIVYNVTPGQTVAITVKHPTCTMKAFPVDKPLDVGTITYVNASLAPLAGKSTGFVRVFLK